MSAGFARTFASLRVPNYRRYFSGQVVSLTGNWMQTVAEMWLVVQLTGSGVSVGLTAGLQFLPILLFGAWGGLLADRVSKRRLLMITQSLMAIPALTLWALTTSGSVEIWMVYALVFARGTVNAIDNPARQSFVIEMVGADRVVNAVALNSVIVHTARILGPAAAGGVIALLGVGPCFLVNALSFGAMLVALKTMDPRRLHTPEVDAPRQRPAPLGAALRGPHAEPADPAGHDGRGRHAQLQLPDPAPAAGQLHLARHRRDSTPRSRSPWGSARSPARWPPARAGESARACWSPPRRRSASPSCSSPSPPRSSSSCSP